GKSGDNGFAPLLSLIGNIDVGRIIACDERTYGNQDFQIQLQTEVINEENIDRRQPTEHERHHHAEEVKGRNRLRPAKAGHSQIIDHLGVFEQGLEVQL